MKLPVIAAILLVLVAPAHAGMRHDRVCDIAQEKPDAILDSSQGAFMFGPCAGAKNGPPDKDWTPDERPTSFASDLGAIKCGYQAYREGKQLRANPYKNHALASSWSVGWKMARKSCTTGRPPSFDD